MSITATRPKVQIPVLSAIARDVARDVNVIFYLLAGRSDEQKKALSMAIVRSLLERLPRPRAARGIRPSQPEPRHTADSRGGSPPGVAVQTARCRNTKAANRGSSAIVPACTGATRMPESSAIFAPMVVRPS